MTLRTADVSILEKKFSIYLLLAVENNPGMNKWEIMSLEEGSLKTKLNRLNELIDEGLIETEYLKNHNASALKLTEKGRQIAIKLKKIRNILLKDDNSTDTENDEE